MVFGEGSSRSRAATLLRYSTPSTKSRAQGAGQDKIASNTLTESPLNERTITEEGHNDLEDSQTLPPSGNFHHSSGSNAVANDKAARRIVRTIPSESFNGLSLLKANKVL